MPNEYDRQLIAILLVQKSLVFLFLRDLVHSGSCFQCYKNGSANNQFVHVSWDKYSFAGGEKFVVPYSLSRLNTRVIVKSIFIKERRKFF